MSEEGQDGISDLSFEEALKQLEDVVRQLESGDVPLDKSINLYARGDKLRAHCQSRLEAANARIEQITLGKDGVPSGTQAFDDK